ncbi:MAG: hypothetical protein U1E60_06645 [Reyranellaceae bacterium]
MLPPLPARRSDASRTFASLFLYGGKEQMIVVPRRPDTPKAFANQINTVLHIPHEATVAQFGETLGKAAPFFTGSEVCRDRAEAQRDRGTATISSSADEQVQSSTCF